ncbi:hypothetical protein BD410DRAFT_840599 [Rickenella mellea]|uniref:Extracellular serine-rich protein n=1 Tax=Rickenella mellea TaxID=50990 RepID=A0A4Y7Q251_9AGAM|nr:hypothetical protein BD410DRAFT_840599 [Rickenella mellea]
MCYIISFLTWLVLTGLLNNVAFAETTYIVHIGLEGSFYDPPALIAAKGDIVIFSFDGLLHGVTQSSFENPCVPLPGGFNSGLYGNGANSTAPVPVWALHITDDTKPIYYFCQGIVPASHCSRGMAGAINPPSNTVFQDFLSRAKAVTGTPAPSVGVTLSGIGAFATNSPTPTITMAPTTTVSSTSSSSNTPTVTQTLRSSSHTNKGAVIGGAVGGTMAAMLLCLIVLFFIWYRRIRRQSQRTPSEQHPKESYEKSPDVHHAGYGEYNAQVPYHNNQQDSRRLGELETYAGQPVGVTSLRSDPVEQHQNIGVSLSDNRLTQHSASTGQDLAGVESSSNVPSRQSGYDIKEIAKELADYLQLAPSTTPLQDIGSSLEPIRELPNTPYVDQLARSTTTSRPPQYRI